MWSEQRVGVRWIAWLDRCVSYLRNLVHIDDSSEVVECNVNESPVAWPDVSRGDNYRDLVHVWRIETEVNLANNRGVVLLMWVFRESTPNVWRIHRA